MEKIGNSSQTGKDMTGKDVKAADQKHETNDDDPLRGKKDDAAAQEALLEPLPPKRILVVDDDPAIRRLFAKMLKNAGYEVTLAADGKEGLQRFAESTTDLVITDIVMPGMSGHDFMLELKKDFPDVKIIAISGNEFCGPEIELFIAETLGAVRIFGKPFNVDEVLDAIKTLLH